MKNFNLMRFNKPKGFTLIELMIGISIIALLALIALFTYSGVIRGSRDNQRRQALNAYQQALEVYRRDLGYYPQTLSVLVPTYVSALFVDPSSGSTTGYAYVSLPSSPACDDTTTFCKNYCMYATLENSPPSISVMCSSSVPVHSPAYNYSTSTP